MKRSFVLFAGLLSALSLLVPVRSPSICTGDDPAAILGCLSQVYGNRDVAGHAELLTEDFVYAFIRDGQETSWGRQEEIESTTKMFQNPQVRSLSLEFGDGWQMVPGKEEGTWILDHLSVALQVRAVDETSGEEKVYTVGDQPGYRLFLRLVQDPRPHYRIYRWEQNQVDD